tara:strand:+ start:547 stop:771 length:225 start_codon:yes stop_codon:yes gene_type:complete
VFVSYTFNKFFQKIKGNKQKQIQKKEKRESYQIGKIDRNLPALVFHVISEVETKSVNQTCGNIILIELNDALQF